MDPLDVHEPNQRKGSTYARRLGRRSWLKMVGAVGLLSVGGYALATGLRSPEPRWIAPLPEPAGYGSAAADDGTLYVHVRGSRNLAGPGRRDGRATMDHAPRRTAGRERGHDRGR
jgi:hypothetical protein